MAIRFGSSGDDEILGTPILDYYEGRGGNDLLIGDSDSDILLGGDDNDEIWGGSAVYDEDEDEWVNTGDSDDDYLSGDDGDDAIYSYGGTDIIDGGDGEDTAVVDRSYRAQGIELTGLGFGGGFSSGWLNDIANWAGQSMYVSDGSVITDIEHLEFASTEYDDTILTANNYDLWTTYIEANGGNDRVITGDSQDNVKGGAGDDFIRLGGNDDVGSGGTGDDFVFGGADNDELYGGQGDDYLDGGTGDDYVIGEFGADAVYGNDGNDILDGGYGLDAYYGGDGDDRFILNYGEVIEDVIFDYISSDDTIEVWFQTQADEDAADVVATGTAGRFAIELDPNDGVTEYFWANGLSDENEVVLMNYENDGSPF